MKLVVLGSQPLAELEGWVTEIFSPIANKNLQPPVYSEHPFDQYGKLVKYVPVKDDDHLEVRWIVDYLHPHYRIHPGGYISHLLGHEGENSLLSLLKGEGLALGTFTNVSLKN
jgi:insulysin